MNEWILSRFALEPIFTFYTQIRLVVLKEKLIIKQILSQTNGYLINDLWCRMQRCLFRYSLNSPGEFLQEAEWKGVWKATTLGTDCRTKYLWTRESPVVAQPVALEAATAASAIPSEKPECRRFPSQALRTRDLVRSCVSCSDRTVCTAASKKMIVKIKRSFMTTRKHTPTQVYFTQLYERTIKREGTTYTQGCKKVPVFWNRVTFRQELYC